MLGIEEAVLRTIDPNWIKTLQLYKGKTAGGEYILQDVLPDNKKKVIKIEKLKY